MTAKRKQKGITIANFIAVVGLVLLLVFTFMGRSYASGGELGWDIVISVGITAFSAFLLWFLIKAKGAENKLDNWRKAEYGALAVYILFAIPTSLLGGIMHFFVVNDNKETIKEYAKADLEKIEALFSEYRDFESEALSVTGTGLSNTTEYNQLCDDALLEFMENHNISRNPESTKNFEMIQRNNLLGNTFEGFYRSFQAEKADIENAVASWSVMQIPFKAKDIEVLAGNVEIELSEWSNNAELPEIKYVSSGSYGKFVMGEYQRKDFAVDCGTESFQFRKAIMETDGFSVTALLVVLLIHFLILFNYIVAYRTKIIDIEDSGNDGGILLNNK